MRTYLKELWCGLALSALVLAGPAASAKAVTPAADAESYGRIVERNLFGLRSAPAPAEEAKTAPPPPKIFLTGITTILGNKRALMKVVLPSHPGQPAKEESYILTEGQREGNVEVLEIDENRGLVKVNDFGTKMTLSFDKDGVKPQNTPPQGLPPQGTPPQPLAGQTVQGLRTPRIALPGLHRFPSRNVGVSPTTAEPTPSPTGGPSVPAVLAPPTAAPVPSNSAAAAAALNPPPPGQLTPSEQLLLQELERQQNANDNANPNAAYPNPNAATPYPLPTLPGQGPSVFHRLPMPQ